MTVVVASYLKKKPQIHHVLKVPKTHPLGPVVYSVESELDPITFNKRKDAEAFKRLIATSVHVHKGVIVRREITHEGYIPTYGEKHDK